MDMDNVEKVEKVEKVGRLRVRRRKSQAEIERLEQLYTIPSLPPPVVIHSSSSAHRAQVRKSLGQPVGRPLGHPLDEEPIQVQVQAKESLSAQEIMNRIIMNRLPGSSLNYNMLSETIAEDPIYEEEEESDQAIGINESGDQYQNYGPSTSHQNHTDSNNNEEGEDSDYEKFRQEILAGLPKSKSGLLTHEDEDDENGHGKEVLAQLNEENNMYEFDRYLERVHSSYHDMMKNMEDEFNTQVYDLSKENETLKASLDKSIKHNDTSETEIQDLKNKLDGIQKDLKDKTQVIGLLERKYNDRFFVEGGDCKDKSHDDLQAKLEEMEIREKMLMEELEKKTEEINGILRNDSDRHEQLEKTVAELQSEKIIMEETFKGENRNLKFKYQEAKALLIAQEKFVEEIEKWAKGKEVESYMGIDKFKASVSAIILEANETMAMVSEKIDKLCAERVILHEKTKNSELKTIKSKKDVETFRKIVANFDFRLRSTMSFPLDNILQDETECDPTDPEEYLEKRVEKQLESIFRRITLWRNEVERQKTQDDQRIIELESYLMDQKKINLEEIELYKIKFNTFSRLMLKMRNLVVNMKKSVKKAREEREALRQAMKEKPNDTTGEFDHDMKEKHQKFTKVIEDVSCILESEQISPNVILDEFNF